MRAAMLRHFKTLEGVGERMLPVLSRSLDMPAGHFAPFFENEAHINLRFLHYPPQGTEDDEQFGQAPHTDNSFITMLARRMPAWRCTPSGEWFSASDPRNSSRQPWQRHEALVKRPVPLPRPTACSTIRAPTATQSPFSTVRTWALIECLPSCTGPGDPPRYPPAVYRDLVLDFYNANYFHRAK